MRVKENLSIGIESSREAEEVRELILDILRGEVPVSSDHPLIWRWVKAAKEAHPTVPAAYLLQVEAPTRFALSLADYWMSRRALARVPSESAPEVVARPMSPEAVQEPTEAVPAESSKEPLLNPTPVADRVRALRISRQAQAVLEKLAQGERAAVRREVAFELRYRGLLSLSPQVHVTVLGYWAVEFLRLNELLRTPHHHLLEAALASRPRKGHLGSVTARAGATVDLLCSERLLRQVGKVYQLTDKGFDFATAHALYRLDQGYVQCYRSMSNKAWRYLCSIHRGGGYAGDPKLVRSGLIRGGYLCKKGTELALTTKGLRVVQVGLDLQEAIQT